MEDSDPLSSPDIASTPNPERLKLSAFLIFVHSNNRGSPVPVPRFPLDKMTAQGHTGEGKVKNGWQMREWTLAGVATDRAWAT